VFSQYVLCDATIFIEVCFLHFLSKTCLYLLYVKDLSQITVLSMVMVLSTLCTYVSMCTCVYIILQIFAML
jgi:hypothetical protein